MKRTDIFIYDPGADALYVTLIPDGKVVKTVEIEKNETIVDYDAEGRVVGIELLNLLERINMIALRT